MSENVNRQNTLDVVNTMEIQRRENNVIIKIKQNNANNDQSKQNNKIEKMLE